MTNLSVSGVKSVSEYFWNISTNSHETELEGFFGSIPVEIFLHVLSFSNLSSLGNSSLVCRKFAIIVQELLKDNKYTYHKIHGIFLKFQRGVEVKFTPFPKSLATGHYSLGPLLGNGALLLFEKGNKSKPPGCYVKADFSFKFSASAMMNNGWLPFPRQDIGDNEITSENEKLYFFLVDGDEESRVIVGNKEDGSIVCKIDPFQELSEEDISPSHYYQDNTSFLKFNHEWGKRVVGAHSYGDERVVTITKSGMIRKWALNDGIATPIEKPITVCIAFKGENVTRVDKTWLAKNNLFVNFYRYEECLPFGRTTRTLFQYDIRTGVRMSVLNLSSFDRVTLNANVLIVDHTRVSFFERHRFHVYRIDPDKFDFSVLWKNFSINHSEHCNLLTNNQWLVLNNDADISIFQPEIANPNRYWQIQVILKVKYLYLFEDLIVSGDD